MSEHDEDQPVGPEVDDSPNPTHAAPEHEQEHAGNVGEQAGEPAPGASHSRDMLQQLQQMIDSLATQAGPVMREVAAKAAELAALAGQRAGPIAHRAADATERVGGRVAERSKEMAAELRRQQAAEAEARAAGEPAENREADG